MNIIELQRSLHQLRLGGMAAVLETRLHQAQAEPMAPIDLISCLVSDELARRADRLLDRRRKHADFRDPDRTLDNFDFSFNPKINRSLVFDLATGALSASVKTRARVTWRRPSDKPPSCKATSAVPRNSCATRQAGRGCRRRHAPGVRGVGIQGAAPDHR